MNARTGGTTEQGKRKRRRKIALLAALAGALFVLLIVGSSAFVAYSARGRTFDDVQALPHRRVGLVLGCNKTLANGLPNLFFTYRIEAAAKLFQGGKVDCLLVSGDNLSEGSTEPSDMKRDLVASGVPAGKIYCDDDGLRTLDSVVRAREVFGLTEFTIISQKFHNERAIFIAKRHGLDAIAFNARMPGGFRSFKKICREQFARVKAVLDEYVLNTQPKVLGGKVRIGPGAAQAPSPLKLLETVAHSRGRLCHIS